MRALGDMNARLRDTVARLAQALKREDDGVVFSSSNKQHMAEVARGGAKKSAGLSLLNANIPALNSLKNKNI